MTKLLCFIAMIAFYTPQIHAREKQALRLVQTIPLPGVTGRLDHMGIDLEKKRLFVAAVANHTLDVVDLTGGRVIKSLAGFKDTQDALFLGRDSNKLYVSSLDGHVRVFQGESFWLVQDFKVEPDPNRLFYDPMTNLIYFGYGGQNAGFDAYERVSSVQAPARIGIPTSPLLHADDREETRRGWSRAGVGIAEEYQQACVGQMCVAAQVADDVPVAKSRASGSSVGKNSTVKTSPSHLASMAPKHPCDSFSRPPNLPVFRLPVPKVAVQGRYNQRLFLPVLNGSLQGIAVRPLPCNYYVIQ